MANAVCRVRHTLRAPALAQRALNREIRENVEKVHEKGRYATREVREQV